MDDMTRIAIEEHWTLASVQDAVGALTGPRADPSLALNDTGDHAERLADLGETRLAAMDREGVDLQVLSLAPPGTGDIDPGRARDLSREANALAAATVRRHPERFAALATLPMADPAATADELRRAADDGLVGAMVYGRTGERHLDDPAYRELFAAAEELRMPLFIHPQVPPAAVRAASYAGFDDILELGLATFGWGWHLEAAVAALRVIVSGALDRHPELQLVLGHWGELLPFWSERTNSLARVAGLERSVAEYIRSNVWITNSGMLSPALLRHTLDVTTPDRLVFSTDYPFQHPDDAEITAFLAEFPDDEQRRGFESENARRLFRLPGAAAAAS
jgi:predicted TIM-barrel fold metal-dependent hydrolase